jgi:ABC-2 type transport system ATP-binding protein
MIRVENVSKTFGRFKAVDEVSLAVPAGEIHGFLGPNGAGKSTTIRMIAGLLKPTSGRIVINGEDLARDPIAAKRSLGVILDRPFLYEKLTAGEFLAFHGGLFGIDERDGLEPRVSELLELFDLTSWRDELIESFSHGMRQRLAMCAAFLHRPKAVVIDEPMVGLDPSGAQLIKDIFRSMSRKGVAILMSTHTLEVAQEVCDRVSIIHVGRIIACGTLAELRAMADSSEQLLTPIFLKLTGGGGLREIEDAV